MKTSKNPVSVSVPCEGSARLYADTCSKTDAGVLIMSKEIWKDISKYEGYYQVSSFGRVRSITRIITDKNGMQKRICGRLLQIISYPNGYKKVCLCKYCTPKEVILHRLIAKVFIPNPLNLPEINHKDEIKSNNKVNNLEWVTSKQNSNYGSGIQRRVESLKKSGKMSGKNNPMYGRSGAKNPLFGITGADHHSSIPIVRVQDGIVVEHFVSLTDAAKKLNTHKACISSVLRGKQKHTMGMKFKYLSDIK